MWQLSGVGAGPSGEVFFGYMVAMPSVATNRIDARLVHFESGVLKAAGTRNFALLARNMRRGAFFQALCGAGLASCHMPGLHVLTDHAMPAVSRRPLAFCTANRGIRTRMS